MKVHTPKVLNFKCSLTEVTYTHRHTALVYLPPYWIQAFNFDPSSHWWRDGRARLSGPVPFCVRTRSVSGNLIVLTVVRMRPFCFWFFFCNSFILNTYIYTTTIYLSRIYIYIYLVTHHNNVHTSLNDCKLFSHLVNL